MHNVHWESRYSSAQTNYSESSSACIINEENQVQRTLVGWTAPQSTQGANYSSGPSNQWKLQYCAHLVSLNLVRLQCSAGCSLSLCLQITSFPSRVFTKICIVTQSRFKERWYTEITWGAGEQIERLSSNWSLQPFKFQTLRYNSPWA